MADTLQAGTATATAPTRRTLLRTGWMQPAALLVMLSAIVGTLTILLNPPLRGPDEPAHFVRVFAYTQGIIKAPVERDGRKGIYLPAQLHDDFVFFNERRSKIWDKDFTFHQVNDEYRDHRASRDSDDGPREPRFVLFEGSEGYAPAAYAPHIVAGIAAQAFGLDFATTIYLMRFAGLAAFTAIAAYAVVMTPHLKWAFFLIAMLPAALYGRSVIGADGAVNSLSLLVAALSLRAASGLLPRRPLERALWMTLCILSKPPQIVFILLEPMIHRFRALPARWRIVALVVLPGIILSPLWVWFINAEMASWRVQGNYPPEYFDVGWKLRFMLENPLHFPSAVAFTLFVEANTLWKQLIGVLGWLDSYLHPLAYPLISVALLVTIFERLTLDPAARYRVAFYAGSVLLGYTVLVFLVLFLTWTPPVEPGVWGVQGRYFIPVLPLAAIVVAALVNRQMPEEPLRWAAVAGALVASATTLEAIWRVNWTA